MIDPKADQGEGEELRPNYYKVRLPGRLLDTGSRVRVEIECFDLIDALKLPFYSGNVLKYLFRLGRKTESKDSDLMKIRTYAAQAQERE